MLSARTPIRKSAFVRAAASLTMTAFSLSVADAADRCADAPTPALHILSCTAIIEESASDSRKVEIAHINRGLAYFATNDLKKAIADFSQAIALLPGDANAYEARAIAFAREHDYPQAIADDQKAIGIDPLSTRAYNNLANAYKAQDDLRDALESYNRAIEISPTEPTLYFNRGNTRRALGRMQGAIDDYTYAIAHNAGFLNAYIARGNAYAANGDFKAAKADFDHVLMIDPMNTAAIVNEIALQKVQQSSIERPVTQSPAATQ